MQSNPVVNGLAAPRLIRIGEFVDRALLSISAILPRGRTGRFLWLKTAPNLAEVQVLHPIVRTRPFRFQVGAGMDFPLNLPLAPPAFTVRRAGGPYPRFAR